MNFQAAVHPFDTSQHDTPRSGNLMRTFLNDKNVASIARSSRYVADAVISGIDFSKVHTIVELGPGDGAITEVLLKKMKPDATLLAFETNSDLVTSLTANIQDPRLSVFNKSAVEVDQICKRNKIVADVVVSGIPFSFFSDCKALEILLNVHRIIASTGSLIVYQAWIPPLIETSHIKKLINNIFTVRSTKNVLLNIPPLQVIQAQPQIN